jgi:molybdopterin-synthase adenylyltransferase
MPLVDSLDNIAGRRVLPACAASSGIASVHARLSGDGSFGSVRWGERFEPDAEDEPGQATREAGEHMPFVGLVAATLTTVIAEHVRTGARRDVFVTA